MSAATILADYPGLFWYAIHGAEILFSILGRGCTNVRCISYSDTDIIVGEWRDGRRGIVRGTRYPENESGCVVHTQNGVKLAAAGTDPPYFFLLLQKIMEFFSTGQSPVKIEETLEIIAFLEAADASKANGGTVVELQDSSSGG